MVSQLGRGGRTFAQTPSASGVVNLYSSRHYDTDDAIYDSFTAATGIRVNLIEAESDQLIERIKSEGRNSPADVLMTVDAGRLWTAEQEGLFQSVSSTVLEESIPENLRHPDGLWFGLTKRARVIFYHKDRVRPTELSTYEDLANPKWRGRLLVRSSTHVYNQSLVGSLLEVHGADYTEEWARGIVANLARQPEGGDTPQILAVAAGQGDIAIANTYYFARLLKSENPAERESVERVGIFFPNQRGAAPLNRGTHVNISGAGVLRTAPNKDSAVRFLEYLVSPEAQRLFAQGNNEYPVVASVPLDPVVGSFGTFNVDPMNAAVFGRNNPEALRITDRAGWR
jgi:iron(III) transport system substrate-binding protein